MNGITPDYTRKAIDKYNSKFDRFTVNLPKGYKEIIKEKIGLSCSAYINELIEQDFKKRKIKLPDTE